MIHQPLTDALQAHQHGNAHIPEMAYRANAGAQQMRGRMDRAAGQHDLAATKFLRLAIDQRLHADAARTLEQQLLDLRPGRDREVGALARLAVEITHRRRDPMLVLVGVRDREIAFDELTVLVGQEIVAGELAGLGDGLRMSCPVFPPDAADRDAAVLAVERPVEVEVALDLPEIGQHVLPAPAGSAARFPFIVVGRRAAIGQLAIDRGAAAQHARLLIFAQGRAYLGVVVADDLGRDLEFGPVEARIEIGQARIAIQNLGRLVAGRCVLSRLADENLVGARGGEPVGQHGSRRAATNDNEVVHVWRFPLFLSCEASAVPSLRHAGPSSLSLRSSYAEHASPRRSPRGCATRARQGEAWWARQDSNLQPDRYERPALTIELQAPPRAAARRRPATVPPPFTGMTAIRQCRRS